MHGMKCRDFKLPDPGQIQHVEQVFDASEQAEQAFELISTLNPMQRDIFNEIVKIAHDSLAPSRFFFLDGPGGSGKTYLYNALMLLICC